MGKMNESCYRTIFLSVQCLIYFDGSGVRRMYPLPLGKSAFSKPAAKRSVACSSLNPGTTMHLSPEAQLAGVATLC